LNGNKFGEFCKNISYEWFDPIKLKIDRYMIDALTEIYIMNKDSLSPEEIYKIGKAILAVDELCEKGISLLLTASKKDKMTEHTNSIMNTSREDFLIFQAMNIKNLRKF